MSKRSINGYCPECNYTTTCVIEDNDPVPFLTCPEKDCDDPGCTLELFCNRKRIYRETKENE